MEEALLFLKETGLSLVSVVCAGFCHLFALSVFLLLAVLVLLFLRAGLICLI